MRYYCQIVLANAGASTGMERVSVTESAGAGGPCGSNPSAVVGDTNDANGWPLPGSGGKVEVNGLIAGQIMNPVTCVRVQSGKIPVNYLITYVDQ